MKPICELDPARLEAYLDGELRGRERRHIEHHIAGCDACCTELASERRLRREFAVLPELPCPDSVTQRVLDATVRRADSVTDAPPGASRACAVARPGSRLRTIATGWPVGLAAAVLLAILLGVGLRNPGGVPSAPVRNAATAALTGREPTSAVQAAEQTRRALAVTVRAVVRTEEQALATTFTDKLPRVLRESLSLALARPSGGQG